MKKMERQNFSGNGRILRYAFCIKIDTMRNVVNKSANWIICFLICLCLAGCARSSETGENSNTEYILSYAENQPEGHPSTKAARYFADLVEERTEDRIRVEVYPEGKLGDELSAIHQVFYGGIDFARVSLATVAENGSDAEVLMLPYLYSGREHMWKVLDGQIGTGMLSDFTDQGLAGLAWFDGGARSFYTVGSPVHEPEDLRGLRIRVQDSELMAELVTALGAEPVKAVYADVYKLLDLDQADGAENNLPSYAAENHYRLANYYTLDEHSRIPELLAVSKETMRRLDEKDREVIRQCASEASAYQRQLWQKYEKDAMDTVEDAGCQIISLSQEEKQAFKKETASLWKEYFPGKEALIKEIQDAQ